MNLEMFEQMVKKLRKDISSIHGDPLIRYWPIFQAKVLNAISVSRKFLPDHEIYLDIVSMATAKGSIEVNRVVWILDYILELLEIEKTSSKKLKEMKIFDSAEDKLKQAGISFRNEDYPSSFHNLNTSLELALKDKLKIPTTITQINTSKILDILVKEKIGPHSYFKEIKKRVIQIDNKIKHQGYSPTKIECLNGIKALEELFSKLRDIELELSEDIRNKIYKKL